MKIHPRELVTQQARLDLTNAFLKIAQEHQLTPTEEAQVVEKFSHAEQANFLNRCLRLERHGDEETPSGLEKE